MMNLRSLRYFLKVADLGNLTRAASELHLTQPALTRHINDLESHLGVKLLARHTRGVELTESGQLLRKRADDLLERIAEMTDELRARVRQPQGVLAIGMPISWTDEVTLPVLQDLRDTYPDLRIKLMVDISGALAQALKSRDIHAAVLTEADDDSEFRMRALAKDRFLLIGPPGSDLKEDSEVAMTELGRRPMILPLHANVVRREIDRVLSTEGLRIDGIIVTSTQLILPLVERGIGYAILPAFALTAEHRARKLTCAPVKELSTTWTFATSKTRPETAAVTTFRQMVQARVKALVSQGKWQTVSL
jgi:LysR family transcriptional regulator, nitrogen assimilation regulatory protein